MSAETVWLLVGFAEQALFMLRLVVEWRRSERALNTVIRRFWAGYK
ncbi:hypothetical protein Q4S45_10490 [Massilia sp. R2A-15]|nr:hypothetical protein [Massilia sp. R2A-15]WLI91520.1 hypothetical protein Q4S45_10490 [Massilia sp. R2A-15]